MSILNFGSCCIDNVYSVPHFVAPGETLPSSNYEIHPGGKGLNQSLALCLAGATVTHAGKVGSDGQFLKDLLTEAGVDTEHLQVADEPSGHAIIQVVPEGENSIVLFGGTNRTITHADVDRVLSSCQEEYLLLQNEISSLDYIMKTAHGQGRKIIFNAAPMTTSVLDLPLEAVHLLIVNEIEGAAIAGSEDPVSIIENLTERYPDMNILLTLGGDGAVHVSGGNRTEVAAQKVAVTDTTGAGDTFTDYFVAGYVGGRPVGECLEMASRAAAICVTRKGAASSIPRVEELG